MIATFKAVPYNEIIGANVCVVELKNKYFGQKDPFIEVVDMRNELKEGNFSVISKQ